MAGNDDIQANHQILRVFENAKGYNDQILDDLPGIYIVFSRDGQIHRGNRGLAELIGLDFENIHIRDLADIMTAEDWIAFQEKIAAVRVTATHSMNFEMDLTFQGRRKSYLFYLSVLAGQSHIRREFYTLLGQDVTDVKSVARENERMQSELKTAQEVQNSLFPKTTMDYEGASIAGSYVSATECGGDWLFYNKIGEKVFLWIGDVTGHGVSAALVVAAVRSAVVFLEDEINLKPSEILQKLNKVVIEVSKGEKYMSFFVAAIDQKTGECWYSHAGHHAPYLISKASGSFSQNISPLESESSELLGLSPNPTFRDRVVQLKSDDFLIAYTDGVIEMRNKKNLEFGERRFFACLKDAAKRGEATPEHFLDDILKTIQQFKGDAPLDDDQTLVVLQKKRAP